jgi:hypothetical protein
MSSLDVSANSHFKHALVPLTAAALLAIGATAAGAADPVPGTVITKTNMDAYERYLPPSVFNMLDYGMTITVAENRSCPWPKPFVSATEHYSAQVKLGADKRHLEGYVAGMPFPKSTRTMPTRRGRSCGTTSTSRRTPTTCEPSGWSRTRTRAARSRRCSAPRCGGG